MIDEDDYELDDENDEVVGKQDSNNTDTDIPGSNKVPRSRKAIFLESVENKVDKTNTLQIERLNHLKMQVQDHLKLTKSRRNRTRTNSKRKGSNQEEDESLASRPRTTSPQ